MLLGALILITTTLTVNGFPPAPSIQSTHQAFQDSGQQQVLSQIPEQQEFIFPSAEQNTDQDYFSYDDSKSTSFGEEASGFTITCAGKNKICSKKSDCVNGYIRVNNNALYSIAGKVQQCQVSTEVCCTVVEESHGASVGSQASEQGLGSDASTNVGAEFSRPFVTGSSIGASQAVGPTDENAVQSAFPIPTHVQLGCAAALLCVEEKFCTADGTISPEPVTLSAKQSFQRVPLSSCKNPDNGIIGKCCRDPNYVDPWPTGNLPANYSGGFDEQGFPTFLNIAKVKPVKTPTPTQTRKTPTKSRPKNPAPVAQKPEPTLIPDNSVISSEVLIPPIENVPEDKNRGNKFNAGGLTVKCGVRHKVPQKAEESLTTFAEIPWQAMVLHSKDRKILCSGALVGIHDVLTAANCVDSMLPNDISIKLGEWKLGYELKQEEPLPFEILNVSYVNVHPGYKKGYGDHDLAMLHLDRPASLDYHINPLCLPDTETSSTENRPCITTGWGKSILQAHYAGAIMHAVNLDILSTQRCQEQVASTNVGVNVVAGTICAATKQERNNVCETDVGAPLACENNGVYELAGIYSHDTGCLPSNQVAIFAPSDNKWIREMMLKPTPSGSYSTLTEQSKSNTEIEESLLLNDYRQSSLSTDNQYLPPH